jgi:hypothetical protein
MVMGDHSLSDNIFLRMGLENSELRHGFYYYLKHIKPNIMARQNNRSTQRDRRNEGQKRDAAANSLRVHADSRETRFGNDRERDGRPAHMNRFDWNDLYERSSI